MNTRCITLAFLLCMVSLPTYAANWIHLGENTDGSIFFIDRSSLQRDGDTATFWMRVNYKERREQNELSVKYQQIINCRRRERIVRYVMAHDDIDNRGHLISSFDPKDTWTPIPPETTLWNVMLFVCRK
jgi:hypothetical protein